jgi:microcystin-dependent protein
MSDPYIGEIRMAGFSFAPQEWALCNGQLLNIADNDALFSILGTTYGGDGITTFALPDLRGRVPMHPGGSYVQGQSAGETQHTLTAGEIPAHTHQLNASTVASHFADPTGRVLGNVQPNDLNIFRVQDNTSTLAGTTVGFTGGSQPHENMQPYTVVNFVIALYGIYPPRT